MKELIIQINHGGLGDHLFHSHLPKLAKTIGGYQKFYVSNQSQLRNSQISDLVWSLNPYFDGFTDKPGKSLCASEIKDGNLLDSLMLQLNMDDGQRMHEPEIFYKPKNIPSIKEESVFDPNYVSFVGYVFPHHVKKILHEKDINCTLSYRPMGKSLPLAGISNFIERGMLTEYCDIISSSKNFICYTSGSATLASALGKKSIVFYGAGQNKIFHHSKLHEYICGTPLIASGFINFYSEIKEKFKETIKYKS
jgi:hypothetical protein